MAAAAADDDEADELNTTKYIICKGPNNNYNNGHIPSPKRNNLLMNQE